MPVDFLIKHSTQEEMGKAVYRGKGSGGKFVACKGNFASDTVGSGRCKQTLLQEIANKAKLLCTEARTTEELRCGESALPGICGGGVG